MLKLHNTLVGELEEFYPIDGKSVQMFVCGPTVYDYTHIGNAKTYTQFDFVARALRYLGYDLRYIVNITDIDDKIITRAKEREIEPEKLVEEFETAYLQDMKVLNNTSVDQYARAHDYIPEIVSQVKRLVEKGYAYKISDGYYFDIKMFPEYGKLSGRDTLKPEDSISRVDENPEKKDPRDFCLWKFKKEGDPSWDSELGEGRPGWHIEDTAITEKEFGSQYDIHGGAVDLIFPHHEAEIAQMEAISGKVPLVRYWMHSGFLNVESRKMSKSLGNFFTIRDVLERGFSPLTLRYYFLNSQYRTPANFTWEALEAAQNALQKLQRTVSTWQVDAGVVDVAYKAQFVEKIENDLNTPQALAVLWTMLKDKEVKDEDKLATILDFDKVLGLGLE